MWYNDITSELMYPENQQLVYNFLFKIEKFMLMYSNCFWNYIVFFKAWNE